MLMNAPVFVNSTLPLQLLIVPGLKADQEECP